MCFFGLFLSRYKCPKDIYCFLEETSFLRTVGPPIAQVTLVDLLFGNFRTADKVNVNVKSDTENTGFLNNC